MTLRSQVDALVERVANLERQTTSSDPSIEARLAAIERRLAHVEHGGGKP